MFIRVEQGERLVNVSQAIGIYVSPTMSNGLHCVVADFGRTNQEPQIILSSHAAASDAYRWLDQLKAQLREKGLMVEFQYLSEQEEAIALARIRDNISVL